LEIPFIKIEGLGNDYIYIDAPRRRSIAYPALARAISDRHHGVGGDGLIVMSRTGDKSAGMVIYNSDGSMAEFCGNGLRGTALYLKTVYKSAGKHFTIATLWNLYQIELLSQNPPRVLAELGSPSFAPEDIGFRGKNTMGVPIRVRSSKFTAYCMAQGNPHAVIFVKNFDFDWKTAGAAIEHNRLFENKINVMFTKVVSSNKITVVPWERGAGATRACGSGAAAATVISNILEYTKGTVRCEMPGGTLITKWNIEENRVYQEGPTRIAFSGIYSF
jgi:diaminopimelate epimerase